MGVKKLLLGLLLVTSLILTSCAVKPAESQGSKSEEDITINPGEWQLPGTFTIPGGKGPFPIVVLVHGSGPSDRDETVGKQKTFKDLSEDLASLGIASVRYDKRTNAYGKKLANNTNFTVKEETIDDVFNAIEAVKANAKIDSSKIYVAGHSLGGYLIPRIDKVDTSNQIAGYISLAGSARPMTELYLEQVDYLNSIDTKSTEADKAAAKQQWVDVVNHIKQLTESDRGSNRLLIGAYPTYWLDIKDYKPDEEVLNVKEPMLFLQGEHDYQVTIKDFNLWKDALKDNKKAEFKSYADLTHSFVKSEKFSTPDDYNTEGKVDSEVAKDISDFIAKQK